MTAVRAGVDDGGVLLLQHDGRCWVMLNLSGTAVYRNEALAVDDAKGACRWAHTIVAMLADRVPDEPQNAITAVRCYTFHERDGALCAELTPGRVHNDGHGWVLVDGRGEITHRNQQLDAEDHDGALAWANTIAPVGRRTGWRDRWRVEVGRFPDGTYGDAHGRLGQQRLRRAWNRLLASAR